MQESKRKEAILQDAIDTFGTVNQLEMAIEECAELIQALNKIKRTFHYLQLKGIKEQTVKFDSVKDALIYAGVCSEIADVKIMIKQLELIFNTDHISISEARKMDRLEGRIKKFKDERNIARLSLRNTLTPKN